MHSILVEKFLRQLEEEEMDDHINVVSIKETEILIHCKHPSYSLEAWSCFGRIIAARKIAFIGYSEPIITIRYGVR